ncbi:hypothetical protein GCM10007390_30270 [Persicitalea jodogahamensis]|uniref:Lasso RiPP family leader peptide-containing protein n=1 Tax=Persicitalea jodogahamensis TaxID=402147 RepID=A0A8J3D810_9BACT|nr:hypothetical protein GCM10007390_30270 [Persicitalea jodogahamensis]
MLPLPRPSHLIKKTETPMNTDTTKGAAARNAKKQYVKPVLKTIGSVSELTLKGGSQTDAFSNFSS